MNVLISGSRGFIGSALYKYLASRGHMVGRMVRAPRRAGRNDVRWDPNEDWVDTAAMEGRDAVVHLAGEGIAGRWSGRKRLRIRESRMIGTRLLCEALRRLTVPPAVFASASAVGYYGDRGEEMLTEESRLGTGYLADLCRDWEALAVPAERTGVRAVQMRFGMVLSPEGGVLKKMLRPFRLCLGGRLGSGRQYWSWIAMADALAAVDHVLMHDEVEGPVNFVAPQAVTNRQFTKALARAVRRPAWWAIPGFVARLRYGRMAGELLLASTRAVPEKLLKTGFQFAYPEIGAALKERLK
jgi:uncharacterized protein (TIGR01777 family)